MVGVLEVRTSELRHHAAFYKAYRAPTINNPHFPSPSENSGSVQNRPRTAD